MFVFPSTRTYFYSNLCDDFVATTPRKHHQQAAETRFDGEKCVREHVTHHERTANFSLSRLAGKTEKLSLVRRSPAFLSAYRFFITKYSVLLLLLNAARKRRKTGSKRLSCKQAQGENREENINWCVGESEKERKRTLESLFIYFLSLQNYKQLWLDVHMRKKNEPKAA